MQYLSNSYSGLCTRLSSLRDKAPSRLIQRGSYGMACGFYTWSTWHTARSVMSATASCGLNCLKNPDPNILVPFVKKSAILALREDLPCVTQVGQILLLSGLAVASVGAVIYCAHKAIEKSDWRLHTPPNPPSPKLLPVPPSSSIAQTAAKSAAKIAKILDVAD